MACLFGQSANLILPLTEKILFCQCALIFIIQAVNYIFVEKDWQIVGLE